MPGIAKLHLEDSLEGGPQTKSLLNLFENDAMSLKKYSNNLHNCCQRILSAQNELCAATQSLSQQLRMYEVQKSPLEMEDSILISTLNQLATYLDDISSVQQVLAAQFSETMMYPLSKFLQADLEEISTMFEMYRISSDEHEQAMGKYMKLSKKKDNERLRRDANEELYTSRKKFHQTALHYYASLNALQYKRKCFLLEPILGYIHAQRTFFQMGYDAIVKKEIEEFLNNITASVQGVQQELSQDNQKTIELIDTLENQSHHLYQPEPMVEMPYIPPNVNLISKAGYLFMRSKHSILVNKWERGYFFTQGGNLMYQFKDEVAGSLALDLSEEGMVAECTDADDRRFCFVVHNLSTKKSVILQAENERERDEWIATMNNILRNNRTGKTKQSDSPSKKMKDRVGSVGSKDYKKDSFTPSVSIEETSSGSYNVSTRKSSDSCLPSNTTFPDSFLPDVPIQFDLMSPSEDIVSNLKEELSKCNLLDDVDSKDSTKHVDNSKSFPKKFTVRFIGSMEVPQDRGEALVNRTMRHIMAARAIHNVLRMTESEMIISDISLRLVDPTTNNVRTAFKLGDISYWCGHKENDRLLGFITVNKEEGSLSYICHVFESSTPVLEICQSIGRATSMAFKSLMQRKMENRKKEETELLLANISKLQDKSPEEDKSTNISPDGKFLVFEGNKASSAASCRNPDVDSGPIDDSEA